MPETFDAPTLAYRKKDYERHGARVITFNSYRSWGKVGWIPVGDYLLPYHRVSIHHPWKLVHMAIPPEYLMLTSSTKPKEEIDPNPGVYTAPLLIA